MLTVTTYPDFYRNELFRTPLRANYMGMKCLRLPRTALKADFLESEPSTKLTVGRLAFRVFPSFDIFMRKGCGRNCGCTLLHIGNVSSIYE